MTNRTLAILGIVTYIFSVYSTQTTDGIPSVSPYIIIASSIASFLFTIFATIRLWKIKKAFSIFFAVINTWEFISEFIKEINSPANGSSLILAINIVKILTLLSFIYAIVVLWKDRNNYD